MERIELENRLDRDARRFLASLDYYGGKATTTEIRSRTGMAPSVTHSRYDILEDLGLIDVQYSDQGIGDRQPPKIASLTGQGRAAIEWGILHDIDVSRSPEEIRDLESEVRSLYVEMEELREKLNAAIELNKQQGERIEELEHNQVWILEWTERAEDAIRDLRNYDG